ATRPVADPTAGAPVSPVTLGGLLGGSFGVGAWLIVVAVHRSRRPRLVDRTAPYLRDVVSLPEAAGPAVLPTTVGRAVISPWLRRCAAVLERLLGGSTTVRRQLVRLGVSTTLE